MNRFYTTLTLSCCTFAASFGCQRSSPPATGALSPASVIPASAPSSKHSQQQEVQFLIEQATRSATDDGRALAALATADRATGDIANTITAIDAARKVIVSNLQNLDTIAYKASTVRLEDGRIAYASLNMDQGSCENTGRSLDVAIQGNGFLRVKIADSIGGGVGYIRNGNFFINNTGELVLGLGDGYKLIPPISFPPNTTEISISQEGDIEVVLAGNTTKQNIGAFTLVTFMNPEGLHREGGSIYTETQMSGPPVNNRPGEGNSGQFLQGFLECSNVDVTRERLRLAFLNDWRKTLLESAGTR